MKPSTVERALRTAHLSAVEAWVTAKEQGADVLIAGARMRRTGEAWVMAMREVRGTAVPERALAQGDWASRDPAP